MISPTDDTFGTSRIYLRLTAALKDPGFLDTPPMEVFGLKEGQIARRIFRQPFDGDSLRIDAALAKYLEWIEPANRQSVKIFDTYLKSERAAHFLDLNSVQVQFPFDVDNCKCEDFLDCQGLSVPSKCRCDHAATQWNPMSGSGAVKDLSPCQRYLNDTKDGGIGVDSAHTFMGGMGSGVEVVDMEAGRTDHVELSGVVDHPSPCKSVDSERATHGTAVLGLLAAPLGQVDTDVLGIKGLVSKGKINFVQVDGLSANNLESCLNWALRLDSGSVILIEMQFALLLEREGRTCCSPLLPVEASLPCRDVISKLCDAGIYVVEAAGNGACDLARICIYDSGAIMVGASCGGCSERWSKSNYGARVDLHSLGSLVTTLGSDHDSRSQNLFSHKSGTRSYTQSFNGTSSASALCAGCIGILVGLMKAQGKKGLPDSRSLRKILGDSGNVKLDIGTPVSLEAFIAQLQKENYLPCELK